MKRIVTVSVVTKKRPKKGLGELIGREAPSTRPVEENKGKRTETTLLYQNETHKGELLISMMVGNCVPSVTKSR